MGRSCSATLSPVASCVIAASATTWGLLHATRGDWASARTSFERALRLKDLELEALAWLTDIDLRQRRIAEARARIETRLTTAAQRGLTGVTDNVELLLLAGRVFVADGDSARAEEVLKRAIEIDPLHTETFGLLTSLYVKQNRIEEARRVFDETARTQPDNVAGRLMSAMLVHAQGNVPEARKRYEEILTIEPRTTIAANNLASILTDAGENLDVAERWAETAIDLVPTHAGVHDTLGMVYYRRQRYREALQRFQQSVELAPHNAVYRYHLAMVYAKNGEVERARESLRLALDRNPDHTDARQLLASLTN